MLNQPLSILEPERAHIITCRRRADGAAYFKRVPFGKKHITPRSNHTTLGAFPDSEERLRDKTDITSSTKPKWTVGAGLERWSRRSVRLCEAL